MKFSRSNASYNLDSTIYEATKFRNIGGVIETCQLIVEWISEYRCQCLSSPAKAKDYALLLQKTYTAANEQLFNRGIMQDWKLTHFLCSSTFRSATCIKKYLSSFKNAALTMINNVYFIIRTKVTKHAFQRPYVIGQNKFIQICFDLLVLFIDTFYR